MARALVFEDQYDASLPLPRDEGKQRATIITTLPATAILPLLRDIVRYQVQAKLGPRHVRIDAELRRCLEAISISRIFDIEGLWEVLRELDGTQDKTRSPHNEVGNEEAISSHFSDGNRGERGISEVKNHVASSTGGNVEEGDYREKSPEQADADRDVVIPTEPLRKPRPYSPERITELPPLRIGPELRPPVRKAEILDSEDEEPLSSSPLSSPPLSAVAPESPSQSREQPQPPVEPEPPSSPSPDSEPGETRQSPEVSKSAPTVNSQPPIQDIILITHFSALLTTLFTHSDKPSAHTNLQNLSLHLRHLAHEAGSLIMLLNTTTSSTPESTSSSTTAPPPPPPPPNWNNSNPITRTDQETPKHQRPLDPTLRSIFNPAIPQHFQGGYKYNSASYNAAASRLARRNKPSFGASFAQFLDLHLLCTKIPRTRDDAETAVALGPVGAGEDVRYAWVVEALLDEALFWDWGRERARAEEGEGEGEEDMGVPMRVNREQRWAAVDVRDRVVVVNAFTSAGGGGGSAVNRGPRV
ncbi:hypothetical protein RRF57_002546 [Xylaria bambusicola]|uniref:Uncharacterized protein n=1 Tax=Xylaria bambusicola TaxID=326684 RepID=A0AAN7UKG2_9PEZI